MNKRPFQPINKAATKALQNVVEEQEDRIKKWRVVVAARIDKEIVDWIERKKGSRTSSEFINQLLTWAYQTYEEKK